MLGNRKWKNLYIFQVVPWLSPVIFRRCLFQPLVFFLANHCQKSWCFKKFTNPHPGACFWTLNRNPDFRLCPHSPILMRWHHLISFGNFKVLPQKVACKSLVYFFGGITKGTFGEWHHLYGNLVWIYNPGTVVSGSIEPRRILYLDMISFLLLGMLICDIPISYCSRKNRLNPGFAGGDPDSLVDCQSCISNSDGHRHSSPAVPHSNHLFGSHERLCIWEWIRVGDFCRKGLRCLSKHGSKNKKRKKAKKKNDDFLQMHAVRACACPSLYSYTP